MKNATINSSFAKEYLESGNARDNMIFTSCPLEVMGQIYEYITSSPQNAIPCIIKLTNKDEQVVEKILNNCANEFQKNLLAQQFVTATILNTAMGFVEESESIKSKKQVCKDFLSAFYSGSFSQVVELYKDVPMAYQVNSFVKKYGKMDIDFFLYTTQNKDIQRAINNFVSARESYVVKVFTDNKFLPSYITQNQQRIESPHDYLSMNINNFLVSEAGCDE